jgi:hypothetical protein
MLVLLEGFGIFGTNIPPSMVHLPIGLEVIIVFVVHSLNDEKRKAMDKCPARMRAKYGVQALEVKIRSRD